MKKLLTILLIALSLNASAQIDTTKKEPVKPALKMPPDSLLLLSLKELDEIERSIENSLTVTNYKAIKLSEFILYLKQFMIEKYNTEKKGK